MAQISIYLNEKASNANTGLWKRRLNQYLFRNDITFKEPQNLTDARSTLAMT